MRSGRRWPATGSSASTSRQNLELRDRLATLTPRERQVLALVVTGMLNKQIAGELGTTELTIKAHRGRVMRKMQAASFADLVRMAEKLEISSPGASSSARAGSSTKGESATKVE